MNSDIFSTLNKSQHDAVSMKMQPILVLAGPGTGKTRLLIARITWLIEKENISPERILALTFTNKAAGEMKSRLINVLGEKANEVYTSTFHSFALQLLRRYHHHAGLGKFFTVCDQDYQFRLVQNLAAPYIRENLENKVRGIVLSFSNHQIKSAKMSQFARDLFREYQNHLKKHNLIDFDQIIIKCQGLLRSQPDVLEEYRHLYPAILIDEFQDTDPLQYDILKLLSKENKNIFAVADDDQSIYSWRGANPENIKLFLDDFNIDRPLLLEINYRSGDNILKAANRIIQKTNRIEPDKKLKIDGKISDKVEFKFFPDEKEEVAYILAKIADWTQNGVDFKNIALIYPYHKIGQSLEQYLLQNNIPFQMAEGRSILDHPVIRKVILHLKLIRDSEDPVALEELVRDELGYTISGMIKQAATQNSLNFRQSLYNYYRDNTRRLSHDMRLKIQIFVNHLANLINLKEFYSFSQLLDEIHSGINQKDDWSLSVYAPKLLPLNKIPETLGITTCDLTKKNIYIDHPDKRIRFLARKIISSVLNVKLIEENNLPDANAVTLALDSNLKSDKELIPLYALKNKERRGSLSCLFKFLQWYITQFEKPLLENYVVLDLETTDAKIDSCGIVEIAAIRISGSKKTDQLQSLINPEKPISSGARAVHNISDEQVKNSPTITEFWTELKSFIGNSVIIAHNGYQFDFPILDRFARKIDGQRLENTRFDSLVMARKLFPGQANSIDALIDRFGLVSDVRHRALEDVEILDEIFQILQTQKTTRLRLTSLEMILDTVALGNILESQIAAREDQIFFICGGQKLLSPFSKTRLSYAKNFDLDDDQLRLMIKNKLNQVNPNMDKYQKEQDLWFRIRDMARRFESTDINESIAGFLAYISLNTAQDQLQDINAISLLTYHSAKGLEFDKVILLAMENQNMPSFRALREEADDDRPVAQKLEEQRRLFYVGLTRAKTEVILSAVKNRGGWERESSPFLKDIRVNRSDHSN